ncbi:MAG: branched-chain amino acid ABC transporter permease [Thaumarchaeota archaeon]|nr:branched-chain amino acid ABC transporter permease [Nitrososphaerota archaeon]
MAVTPDQLIVFTLDLIPWIAAFVAITLSLNLEYGFLGIPNFGKVLAVTGGAFVVGSLPGQLIAWLFGLGSGLDYFDNHAQIIPGVNGVLARDPLLAIVLLLFTLVVAALVGGLLGFVSSYPALRLREEYLGMTLLAMGEVLIIVGNNFKPIVGGTLGVFVPSFFSWVPHGLRPYAITGLIGAVALASLLFVYRVTRSPWGRVLRAVRDDEVLAASLGKDVVNYRRNVLIIAGAIAALGGAMLALNSGAVNARNFSRVNHTFIPWVMVIVGGAANNLGVVIGTVFFVVMQRVVDVFKPDLQPYVPFDVVWLNPILLSLSLIFVMMYWPNGIVRERPTRTLTREELDALIEKKRMQKS